MTDPRLITTPGFREEPYWWCAAPPDTVESDDIDGTYDAVVIGSGITGLRAAIDLARSGARVLVCDKDRIGAGAARRNAGFLGRTLKKTYGELKANRGKEYATAVYGELHSAYNETLDFIAREDINCFAARCGRLIAATSRRHLDRLVADATEIRDDLALDFQLVEQKDFTQEMGSDAYCGGILIPDLGSLHPGLYHKGLLDLARAAGATVASNVEVLAIERDGLQRYRVTTAGRGVRTTYVVVTTNGYTTMRLRWYARRVIPFTGYMAATEELPRDLLDELIPHGRTIIDSNFNIDYFRQAPDSSRLLFGGTTGSTPRNSHALAKRLHALLIRIYPQLRGTRLEFLWSGKCAATFDMMPHIGRREGILYGMGYNFAGVPMGTRFGMLIARSIVTNSDLDSVFARSPFRTAPFYYGNPWFLSVAFRLLSLTDRKVRSLKGWRRLPSNERRVDASQD